MDKRQIQHWFNQCSRFFAVAILGLLLSGCANGLVTIVTATPAANSNSADGLAVQATDVPQLIVTSTRRPRRTATPASNSRPTARATRRPRSTPTVVDSAPVNTGDYQTVNAADLPPEAQDTLALIDQNGPFPYSNDGIVFQNREGILPHQASSYYHEYTVVTPGASDRGARRIITGAGGEVYYTDDHYATFSWVVR